MVPVSFANTELLLTKGRALYWPAQQALLVADLHLEKASFYARHGQMLPPYDSRETLERVAAQVRETGARRVITLGDNFHDPEGAARLDDRACGMLEALTGSLDWIWITGNHDVGKDGSVAEAVCGGTLVDEMELGGIVLRHRAQPGETRPEISGHYHPKLMLSVQRRRISRACAVLAEVEDGVDRMIAPAFGTLTGGMPAGDPAILKALQPARRICALVPTRERVATFPLWRSGTRIAA